MMILQLIFNNGPKNTCLSTVEVMEPPGGCWAKVQGDIFYFPSFHGFQVPLTPCCCHFWGARTSFPYFVVFKSCIKNSPGTDQKMFKNWSLHPWKTLSALPPSYWIFPGCGEIEVNPSWLSQLYKVLNSIFWIKRPSTLWFLSFPSRLRCSPCAEGDERHRHHSVHLEAPTVPVKRPHMEHSGEGKSTFVHLEGRMKPWWLHGGVIFLAVLYPTGLLLSLSSSMLSAHPCHQRENWALAKAVEGSHFPVDVIPIRVGNPERCTAQALLPLVLSPDFHLRPGLKLFFLGIFTSMFYHPFHILKEMVGPDCCGKAEQLQGFLFYFNFHLIYFEGILMWQNLTSQPWLKSLWEPELSQDQRLGFSSFPSCTLSFSPVKFKRAVRI